MRAPRHLDRSPRSAGAAFIVAAFLVAGAAAAGNAEAFHPLSVTFVSTEQGWVVGTGRCGERVCVKLFETSDGGVSWSDQRLPAALVDAGPLIATYSSTQPADDAMLEIRFADPRDGWIYVQGIGGSPMLWSTHDGGKVWRDTRPRWLVRRSMIFDLEAAAGTVYLLGANDSGRVVLARAAVTTDEWRIVRTPPLLNPAGGGMQQGSVVLQGRSGWLVEGNDRGTTGSARLDASGRWVAWTPPCAAVGNTFAVPAANPSSLVSVCVMGGFASPLPRAAPPGATLHSSWLYVSTDGGKTFGAGAELNRFGYVYDGVLATPAPGVLLLGVARGAGQLLTESFDSGVRWNVCYLGNVVYLGFTTPTQGVGIVGPQTGTTGTTRLIMSYDGGRHWRQVGP